MEDVDFDDPKRPLYRALKLGSIALLVLTIVSLIIWGALRDLPGIWGVLIGAAIGGGFVLFTALSVLVTANTSASTTLAVVLGGWLVKIVVLILVLAWLRTMDFYDQTALGVTTIAALVVVLATETWGVITTRVTYVS
ncbi:hypothetical protein ACXZ66_06210 [Corynebacterium sp. S7]